MRKISTGKGYELELPTVYKAMKKEAEREISSLTRDKPKARRMWTLLKDDPSAR